MESSNLGDTPVRSVSARSQIEVCKIKRTRKWFAGTVVANGCGKPSSGVINGSQKPRARNGLCKTNKNDCQNGLSPPKFREMFEGKYCKTAHLRDAVKQIMALQHCYSPQ